MSCIHTETYLFLADTHTSLSLSVFFYLAHPQSLSITSLLLPSLFSLVCLPIFFPSTVLPMPMPNGFEQGSQPCSHLHLREIQLDWKPINHGEYRAVIGFGPGWRGEVGGQKGGWFDFSSAPMKVDLMYYCYGRTDRLVCVCVWLWLTCVMVWGFEAVPALTDVCGGLVLTICHIEMNWVSCYISYFRH